MISQIIKAAKEVYQLLGPNHSEVVYQNALEVELRLRGIPYESQPIIPIYYKGYHVGSHRLDLLVDKQIIVELKITSNQKNRDQLQKYLYSTACREGLLIEFISPDGPLTYVTSKTNKPERTTTIVTESKQSTDNDVYIYHPPSSPHSL